MSAHDSVLRPAAKPWQSDGPQSARDSSRSFSQLDTPLACKAHARGTRAKYRLATLQCCIGSCAQSIWLHIIVDFVNRSYRKSSIDKCAPDLPVQILQCTPSPQGLLRQLHRTSEPSRTMQPRKVQERQAPYTSRHFVSPVQERKHVSMCVSPRGIKV